MFEIIPGILEKEWSEIEKKLEVVKHFAKTVHVDILDGTFAPNTTFLDPTPFKKYSDDVILELHMMVENPIEYIKPWADAGFKRFLGHIEHMPPSADGQNTFVAKAQMYGEAVLAIDGPTSLEKITIPYEDLDGILCMTITAGFSGQKFDEKHLTKVKTIRTHFQNKPFDNLTGNELFPIEVDGGVNDKTILLAKEAGATRFITTSYLFGSEDPKKTFEKLTDLVNNTHNGK